MAELYIGGGTEVTNRGGSRGMEEDDSGVGGFDWEEGVYI